MTLSLRPRQIIITLAGTILLSGLAGCGAKKTVVPTGNKTVATDMITTKKHPESRPLSSGSLRRDQKLLVDEAMTWLGVPYRFGGEERDGADCSGLTMMVYKKALDIKLPRTSAEQQKFCRTIHRNDLEVGDLVFFCTGRDKSRVSHVGIYLGENAFIHASSTKGVVISHITDSYFTRTYHSSGHVARPADKQRRRNDPETQPLQFEFDEIELDRAIETRIDSLNQLGMQSQKYQP